MSDDLRERVEIIELALRGRPYYENAKAAYRVRHPEGAAVPAAPPELVEAPAPPCGCDHSDPRFCCSDADGDDVTCVCPPAPTTFGKMPVEAPLAGEAEEPKGDYYQSATFPETVADGMREHQWVISNVCAVCGRHREDEGIRGCNPIPEPAPEPTLIEHEFKGINICNVPGCNEAPERHKAPSAAKETR